MTEETHEITCTQTYRFTRDEIEVIAGGRSHYSTHTEEACREWLANNPAPGLTRDEFDALPDGSVVRFDDAEFVKIGAKVGYNTNTRAINIIHVVNNNLTHMTVVSTPPPPKLADVDAVRDHEGVIWHRDYTRKWRSHRDVGIPLDDNLLRHWRAPLTALLPGPRIEDES